MFSTHKHRRKTEVCPNCHTILRPEDNFCPNCGQENHDLKIPLGHLIYEFVESITHFDTKMWETLKAIVRKPGQITKDFIEGKRARYVHPVRMYVFVSFIFFLILGYLSDKGIHSIMGENEQKKQPTNEPINALKTIKGVSTTIGDLEKKGLQISKNEYQNFKTLPYDSLQKVFPKKLEQVILDSIKVIGFIPDSNWKSAFNDNLDEFELEENDTLLLEAKNGKYYFRKGNVYVKNQVYHVESDIVMDSVTTFKMIHYTPAELDTFFSNRSKNYREEGAIKKWFIRQTTVQSTRFVVANKLGTIQLEVHNLISKILKYVSMVMFILMPVVAFLLLSVYYRSRKFYYEHLIFSIQIHSIMFMVLGLAFILSYFFEDHQAIISSITLLIIATYFYKSLRTVYQQSRFKTILKFSFLTFMYGFVFSIMLGFASLFGFLNF